MQPRILVPPKMSVMAVYFPQAWNIHATSVILLEEVLRV